jgi:hypothetical protein
VGSRTLERSIESRLRVAKLDSGITAVTTFKRRETLVLEPQEVGIYDDT